MRLAGALGAALAVLLLAPGVGATGIAGTDTGQAGRSHVAIDGSSEPDARSIDIELAHVPWVGVEVRFSGGQLRGFDDRADSNTTGHRFALAWVPWQVERGATLIFNLEAGGDRLDDRLGKVSRDRVAEIGTTLGWIWSEHHASELGVAIERVHSGDGGGRSERSRVGFAHESVIADRLKIGLGLSKSQGESPGREARLIYALRDDIETHLGIGSQAGRTAVLLGIKWIFGGR